MKNLKVCIVGLGSIGKRHLENLVEVCGKKGITIAVDLFRSGKNKEKELESKYQSLVENIYYDIEDVPSHYDIIIISNTTKSHFETLKAFNDKGRNFFIEKPVFLMEQTGKDLSFLNESKNYYVACPLRHTAIIKYLKKYLEDKEINAVRSIASSYLPDWRPGLDYRKLYCAKKELGGGVAIDLIHEWDYLTYLFGKPNNIYSVLQKVSNLEIETEDFAAYIGEYSDKNVQLHVDYFGRATVRECMIFTSEDTLIADIANSKISWLRTGETIEFNQERNDYQINEIEYFIDLIMGKEENINPIDKAIETLKLTQGII